MMLLTGSWTTETTVPLFYTVKVTWEKAINPIFENISGFSRNLTGFTRTSKLYTIVRDATCPSTRVNMIDTPGFGEKGRDRARIVLQGLDDAVHLAKRSHAPLLQIYLLIRYDRQNQIPDRLRLLARLYGSAVVDFITLVVTKGDMIKDSEKVVQQTLQSISRDPGIVSALQGRTPQVLVTSSCKVRLDLHSDTCFLQLAEHMTEKAQSRVSLNLTSIPDRPFHEFTSDWKRDRDRLVQKCRNLTYKLFRKRTANRKDLAATPITGAAGLGFVAAMIAAVPPAAIVLGSIFGTMAIAHVIDATRRRWITIPKLEKAYRVARDELSTHATAYHNLIKLAGPDNDADNDDDDDIEEEGKTRKWIKFLDCEYDFYEILGKLSPTQRRQEPDKVIDDSKLSQDERIRLKRAYNCLSQGSWSKGKVKDARTITQKILNPLLLL